MTLERLFWYTPGMAQPVANPQDGALVVVVRSPAEKAICEAVTEAYRTHNLLVPDANGKGTLMVRISNMVTVWFDYRASFPRPLNGGDPRQ